VNASGSERPAGGVPSSSAGRSPSSGLEGGLSMEELDVLIRVLALLRTLRFGSVLIVVHEGRVVQIEMAEKIRLR
jgi:hypothetical protein